MFRYLAIFALAACSAQQAPAHDPETGRATSIVNEGVMVEAGNAKILFDPVFEAGIYEQMDEALIARIIAGEAPYDDVDAVFISHAHQDHFNAGQMLAMLAAQPELRLYAPAQAVSALKADAAWDESFSARIEGVDIGPEDSRRLSLDTIQIEVVRVPHTGWPERHAEVQNLIFRVALSPGQRVMHLGDADIDDAHFAPHAELFAQDRTGLAFVPFWFLTEESGKAIIDNRLNSEKAVGIHLGTTAPPALEQSGEDYFAGLGAERDIPATHQH